MKQVIYYLILVAVGFFSLLGLSTIAVMIWDDVPFIVIIFNCFITYEAICLVKHKLKKP